MKWFRVKLSYTVTGTVDTNLCESDTEVCSSFLQPKWYKWSDTLSTFLDNLLASFIPHRPHYKYDNIIFPIPNLTLRTQKNIFLFFWLVEKVMFLCLHHYLCTWYNLNLSLIRKELWYEARKGIPSAVLPGKNWISNKSL